MKPRITEAQWLAARELHDLDLYRSAWKQHRRWRLFGAACCRRAMMLAPDPRFDTLADAAERFADGGLTWNSMKAVRCVLTEVRKELGDLFGPDEAKLKILKALDYATSKSPLDTLYAAQQGQYAFAAVSRPNFESGLRKEERKQLALARDIFGNPFRPA